MRYSNGGFLDRHRLPLGFAEAVPPADWIIGIIAAFASSERMPEGIEPMIVGMGVDITEVKRVEAAIARHGRAFLQRVFTSGEIRYCERHRNAAERYAARFAAKEAAMKALGTGWRRGVRWVDLEVANLPSGRPTLRVHGRSKELADGMGVRRIALSITHGAGLAFAQVIFEGE